MSLYRNKKDGDSKTSPTSRISLPATPSLQAASREPQATGTPSPTSPVEHAAALAAPAPAAAPSTSGAAACTVVPTSAARTGEAGPEQSLRDAPADAAGAQETSGQGEAPGEGGEGNAGDRRQGTGRAQEEERGGGAGGRETRGPPEAAQVDVDMEVSDGETARRQAGSKEERADVPPDNPSGGAAAPSQAPSAPVGNGGVKLESGVLGAHTDAHRDKGEKDQDSLLGLSEELMNELEDVDIEGGQARGARLHAKRRRQEEGEESGRKAAEKLPRVKDEALKVDSQEGGTGATHT